jgi:lipid-A-disaccharide synthase
VWANPSPTYNTLFCSKNINPPVGVRGMKYYIIAGEASGDLHGSNLIKHIYGLDNQANIRCWGGDLMQAQGATVVKHYKDLAFMGFVEVLFNLQTILKNLAFCKEDVLAFKPDVIVLIDYPGFNIKIAEWAKRQNLKTVYYISPQVWAWKEQRVKTIKKCVDKMLVILPFEKDYYQKWDYKVEYVGHPLIEVIEEFRKNNRPQVTGTKQRTTNDEQLATDNWQPATDDSQRIIALLPGSRKQEINVKLPIMLKVSKSFPDFQFVVAKAPGLQDDFYDPFMEPYKNVSAISNQTYNLLNQASAALVTSGTATLETALFGVPEVVCYKGNPISYEIAKRVIRVKYISLVNLIMDKPVVKELIQKDLTTENCIKELKELLQNRQRRAQLQTDYKALKDLLTKGGHASANAAEIIVDFMKP